MGFTPSYPSHSPMEYKPIILSEDLNAVASGKALEYRDSPKAFLNFKEEPEFRFTLLNNYLTHQIINFCFGLFSKDADVGSQKIRLYLIKIG